MARRTHDIEANEQTRQITGLDATMDEAEFGDAGNGADPYGADFTGGPPHSMEDDPDKPDDILPDQIERLERAAKAAGQVRGSAREDEADEGLTAQPLETPPADPTELP